MRRAIVLTANGPKLSQDRLRFAENDGERLSLALSSKRCGFDVFQPPPDITASQARGLIYEKAYECEPEDTFLVYFSGHGRPSHETVLLQLNYSTANKPLLDHLPVS